jgi:hypothetical protein
LYIDIHIDTDLHKSCGIVIPIIIISPTQKNPKNVKQPITPINPPPQNPHSPPSPKHPNPTIPHNNVLTESSNNMYLVNNLNNNAIIK